QAAPTGDRVELGQVPGERRRPGEPGERPVQGAVRIPAGGAAVDVPGDAAEIVRLDVPARGGQGEQGARRAGHAAETGPGRGQHEPADPRGRLVRELLGQDAAE